MLLNYYTYALKCAFKNKNKFIDQLKLNFAPLYKPTFFYIECKVLQKASSLHAYVFSKLERLLKKSWFSCTGWQFGKRAGANPMKHFCPNKTNLSLIILQYIIHITSIKIKYIYKILIDVTHKQRSRRLIWYFWDYICFIRLTPSHHLACNSAFWTKFYFSSFFTTFTFLQKGRRNAPPLPTSALSCAFFVSFVYAAEAGAARLQQSRSRKLLLTAQCFSSTDFRFKLEADFCNFNFYKENNIYKHIDDH